MNTSDDGPSDRQLRLRREQLMTLIAAETPRVVPDRNARRRLGGLAAAGAVVAALATGAVTLASGTPGLGQAAFAVTRGASGDTSITIVDARASASQMTRQLHAAGLDVTIETQMSNRESVGTWVGSEETDVDEFPNLQYGYTSTITVPGTYHGSLTLDVGVPTPAGGNPEVVWFDNLLAPGMPLACTGIWGAAPGLAAQKLQGLGDVIDYYYDDRSYTHLSPAQVANPDERVVQVHDVDNLGGASRTPTKSAPGHVMVLLAPVGSELMRDDIWTGFDARLINKVDLSTEPGC